MFRVILKRHRRMLTVIAVVVLVLGALVCASMVWSRQVTNSMRVMMCSRKLEAQLKAGDHHASPARSDCTDVWNRPIHYFSNGKGFVVVSYGRDGRPDRGDYLVLLRMDRAPERHSNCFSLDGDTVFVSGHTYSACLK
ncbi:MAG: hypothetical protein JW940_28055 [Polyangiaceae bacterium]|nr:hypothetical protein [Polyangiaceae bacterium]